MAERADQLDLSPAMITPGLPVDDPVAAYWFAQVSLRLRREVAWCWYQRGQQGELASGVLPPLQDAAGENLDLVRFARQKQEFFRADTAGRYLTDQLAALERPESAGGRWQWLVEQLQFGEADEFVLALALAARLDAAMAPVFAACLNDLNRPFPTLALAQRLWDRPEAIMACADPEHPLYRVGLIGGPQTQNGGNAWQRPLDMPARIARSLLSEAATLPPGAIPVVTARPRELDDKARLLTARLAASDEMQLVALSGPAHAAFDDWAATLAAELDRRVVRVEPRLLRDDESLMTTAAVCWLCGRDIVLPEGWLDGESARGHAERLLAARSIPVHWYAPVEDNAWQKYFPAERLAPGLNIPPLTFERRARAFRHALGAGAGPIAKDVRECARRFRFQEKMIERVARAFDDGRVPLTGEHLIRACANEAVIEMGALAQRVEPRFAPEELILPAEQTHQYQDILHAMRSLTLVHYDWGTARPWNESGLSVLFCGSPGTGKTMAAEALANALQLPMYRIDLSQVVNKYIGETEKNLKRIFDAAELCECILFFDEADALFGKRTEVKDAHDRFANIEISYLLERMERFKGLAILATNRRKDLDEAFMRRLRYLIEFPVPQFAERRRIWRAVFPETVDTSGLDIDFLAKQFQLAGGHIRSIAFNACLRAADADRPEAPAAVSMRDVLLTVKRELEKMNRAVGPEMFGRYRSLIGEAVR